MRVLSVVVLVGAWLLLGSPEISRAQSAEDDWAPPTPASRPSSGEASFLSGRTLGSGQVFLAAALGWPGIWGHLEIAPDTIVNVGVRVHVLYGSPVMGLVAGAGGELSVPIRVHLLAEGDFDLALRIMPEVAITEGRLLGERDSNLRGGNLGVSSRLEAGVLGGIRLVEHFTLFFGATAGAGLSWVEGIGAGGAGASVEAIGVFAGILGVEALMTRDVMLFGEVQAGAGVARDRVSGDGAFYPQREILRVSLGLGYLL